MALESVPWERVLEGISGAGLAQSSVKVTRTGLVYFGFEIKVVLLLIGERSRGKMLAVGVGFSLLIHGK